MTPGTLLARRYLLGDVVRQTGALTVYRAVDQRLDRPVTLELLDRSHDGDPSISARFEHHARVLAAHPQNNLIGVHDIGSDGPMLYAVLEPVQGATLAELLNQRAPLGQSQAIDLSVAIAGALEAADGLGILDILPDTGSIHVREAGRVKLGGLLYTGPGQYLLPTDSTRDGHIVRGLALNLVALLVGPDRVDQQGAAELPPAVPSGLRRLITRAIEPGDEDTVLTLRDWSNSLRNFQTSAQHVTAVVPRVTSSGVGRTAPAPRTMILPRTASSVVIRPSAQRTQPRRTTAPAVATSCLPLMLAMLALVLVGGGLIGAALYFSGQGSRNGSVVAGFATSTPVTPTAASNTESKPTEVVVKGAIATETNQPTATATQSATATATATATTTATGTVTETATETPTAGTPTVGTRTAIPAATLTQTATSTTTPTVTATETATPLPPATPSPPPTRTPVPLVAIPNVVGQQFDRAAVALSQLGLNLQREAEQETDQVTPGQIIAQTPTEGAFVGPGSTIKVITARPIPPPRVPNVLGQTLDAAQKMLSAVGLTSKASTMPSQEPEGRVIGQQPAAGTQVPKGTQVVLVVSAGDKVAVPNVVGMTEQDAQNAIKAAGLTTAQANNSGSSPAVPIGRVESETPAAGLLVPRGTTVFINVRSK